ncbi:hypothetical protein ACHAXS_014187 [Conticribra weissflogii]
MVFNSSNKTRSETRAPSSKKTNVSQNGRGFSAKSKKKQKDVSVSSKATSDLDIYSELGRFREPIREIKKPPNQLNLTEKELAEDITLILTGDDPNIPKNVCKFSYKELCYKPDPPGQSDNMAIHFSMKGSSMHIDSEDYKKFRKMNHWRRGTGFDSDELPNDVDGTTTTMSTSTSTGYSKNEFDYTIRASQTLNNRTASCGAFTEPPPITQYQEEINQWQIYDSYKSECLISMMENMHEGLSDKRAGDRLTSIVSEKLERVEPDSFHNKRMESILNKVERLSNHNAQDDIYDDFKYWDDPQDKYRTDEATLCPLWKFSYERAKRKQVTALCWNSQYTDLFAAGFGSCDFARNGKGLVCCYTLKNTSHPEFVVTTESGVICLDFHPKYPSLLAVGCHDGSVLVIDIRATSKKPIYSSSLRSGQHSDPVWQIRWHDNGTSKEYKFYTVSSDGKVAHWIMNKNELKMEPMMDLKLINSCTGKSEDSPLHGLAGGCAIDFNRKLDNVFLVGTEEGMIHECSKAYSAQYLKTFEGHRMGVNALKWNPFHEDIFVSCSEDWRLQIFDHNSTVPLLSFDLGNAIGDVCWSPLSSTVFAAATTDGKVHAFDLAQNKRDPLCSQKIARTKLTKIRFSSKDFILIVGDDRSFVHTLKLSPNLRKINTPQQGLGGSKECQLEPATIQRNKMVRFLASIDKKYSQ